LAQATADRPIFTVKMRVALLLLCAAGYQLRSGVSPTQKVIQLLQDMAAKGRQEKQDEEVRFAAYKQFCDGTTAEKKDAIAAAEELMEQLEADIAKAESDAAQLADDIAKLDSDIAGWAADKKEATAIRNKENAEFTATHKDYSESIDALERAVAVLKSQSGDVKQAMMLVQKVSVLAKVPAKARKVLASFLQTRQDPLSVSAPQANAYEFQSGGVVDMLKDLLEKFQDERNTLEKEEMASRQAFEMMVLELTDSSKAAEKERDDKAKTKAQREEDAAGAKGDLADTTSSRNEDKTYLDTLVAQCTQKSDDFAARQQLRAEELEAIAKAVEILSSGAVAGNDDKYRRLPSFAQLRASVRTGTTPEQDQAAAFLQGKAQRLHSQVLALMADKLVANPFGKVTKMIKDMITRLLEEANEEAEHKGWCDKEMGVNKQTREDKTEEVNSLQAQLDQLNAEVTQLGEQIADLADAIAEIDASVVKATEERKAEKAKNKETVEDAKEAQEAVAQALSVLKDFYKKAAAATALVQADPAEDAPETFDKPYTGMGDSAGGVVGMLEVIASDFARLEAETTSAESESQNEYERLMAEASKDKAVKTADMDHKKKSKVGKESDAADTEKDLKGTQKELEAALFYYEKLKPSCVDAGVSYEDRVARREEEIESLRMALQILGGEA